MKIYTFSDMTRSLIAVNRSNPDFESWIWNLRIPYEILGLNMTIRFCKVGSTSLDFDLERMDSQRHLWRWNLCKKLNSVYSFELRHYNIFSSKEKIHIDFPLIHIHGMKDKLRSIMHALSLLWLWLMCHLE